MKQSMVVGMLVVFTGLMVQGCGGGKGNRSFHGDTSSTEMRYCMDERRNYPQYSTTQNEEFCECSLPLAKQYIRGEMNSNQYTHASWDCMDDAGMHVSAVIRSGVPRY